MKILQLLFFYLIFSSSSVDGQVSSIYKRIIRENKINRMIEIKGTGQETELTLLGIVNTNMGTKKYYAIKEFHTVRASSTWHGHSSLYFIDMNLKKFIRYNLSMPDNLPSKLSGNKLFFNYKDSLKIPRRYMQDLKAKLPPNICVAPFDCYYRED